MVERTQKLLYNEWIETTDRIRMLSGIIQNDLNELLKNKIITTNDIVESVIEFEQLFDKNNKKLINLHNEIKELLMKISKNP